MSTYIFDTHVFCDGAKNQTLYFWYSEQVWNGYVKDFGIDGSFNTTKIKKRKEIPQEYAAISKSVAAILDQSPAPS
jgi:hypothetical protein